MSSSTTGETISGPPPYRNLDENVGFPQFLLNAGFALALVLSAACLILSAYYLFSYLKSTDVGLQNLISNVGGTIQPGTLEVAISARLAMARLALLSCGVFVGVSFGFLGFALFLLGIRKEMSVTGEYQNFKANFARLSPGLFIILCSTILIGVCVTRPIDWKYDIVETQAFPTPTATPTPVAPPTIQDRDP